MKPIKIKISEIPKFLHSSQLYRDLYGDEKYIELLVNEFKSEEFIDMDTKYFDKQNIRLKAADVEEKELYGLYYIK